MFIGVGIGALLAVIVNWYFLRPYPQLMKEWRGFPPPEKRLTPSMIAGPVLVVGILWLGWTGNYASIPWYVPVMGSILVGMSIILIFISFLVSRVRACARTLRYLLERAVLIFWSIMKGYVVDAYLMYAASAFAANTMIRSGVAAAFPLFTTQMFRGVSQATNSILVYSFVATLGSRE
jgi:DHA1 family multidrug resistance protein-like MFS transporter